MKIRTLTFTGGDGGTWDTPVTVTVNVATDTTTDDESAMLTHEVASDDDAAYNALASMMVSVAISDNNMADLTITAGTGRMLTLAEGATDGEYTVALDSDDADGVPAKDVTVTITSDNADVMVDTDAGTEGNQNVLTFTPADHTTAQTVVVSVGMDADSDDESAKLSHALASEDSNYTNAAIIAAAGDAGVVDAMEALDEGEELSDEAEAKARADAEKAKAAEFEATVNVEDGGLGVRLSGEDLVDNALTLTETDDDVMGTYSVELQVAPVDHEVTIEVEVDNSRVTAAPASLTFTPDNWQTAQPVTVTAVADANNEHESSTITHTVMSNDLRFDELAVGSVTVNVMDDEPRLAIVEAELEIAEPVEAEDGTVTGGSGSFTVALDAMPGDQVPDDMDDAVTVVISSGNADVTVSTTDAMDMPVEADEMGNVTLTFTSVNWETAQTVMVNVAADEDALDEIATIELAVSSTSSALYGDAFTDTVSVQIVEPVVEVEVPGPVQEVEVPGPTVTRTVTRTETRTETVTVEVPAQPNVIGSSSAATATEVDGRVLVTRNDGGVSLVIDVGGFIRDADLGQTYQVVRRADGAIVRQWIAPNSPLVYQIPWAVVNTSYTVPVGVIGSIPLDDQSGSDGQLVRRFDGGDDRIFSYQMGQWRHVPNIATFQALGLYWCDVTAADAEFFNRISMGAPHPATGMAASMDYPSCSTG